MSRTPEQNREYMRDYRWRQNGGKVLRESADGSRQGVTRSNASEGPPTPLKGK